MLNESRKPRSVVSYLPTKPGRKTFSVDSGDCAHSQIEVYASKNDFLSAFGKDPLYYTVTYTLNDNKYDSSKVAVELSHFYFTGTGEELYSVTVADLVERKPKHLSKDEAIDLFDELVSYLSTIDINDEEAFKQGYLYDAAKFFKKFGFRV